MKHTLPELDVYERDGLFFVRGLTGSYAIGGYKSRVLAECYAANMKHMFRLGWDAREEEIRKTLGLTLKEGI